MRKKMTYYVLTHEPGFGDSTEIVGRGMSKIKALALIARLRREYQRDAENNPSYGEIWAEEGETEVGFVGNYFFDSPFDFIQKWTEMRKC